MQNAVRRGELENVRLFVELDAASVSEVDEKDDGRTPLLAAAHHGHAPIVALLLDAHASTAEVDALGRTALVEAASQNHVDVVRLLIERNAGQFCGTMLRSDGL